MSYSLEQFAESWHKEVNDLTHLDYFSYKLISELDVYLNKEFCEKLNTKDKMLLKNGETIALAFNIGDGLQFFFEKMCFGDGCSLGCPNKLDKPFSRKEEELRIGIIKNEFNGNFESCMHRQDCLSHDVLNYVVLDTVQDFYNYEKNIRLDEKDQTLKNLAELIRQFVVNFTADQGSRILKNPTASAVNLINSDLKN